MVQMLNKRCVHAVHPLRHKGKSARSGHATLERARGRTDVSLDVAVVVGRCVWTGYRRMGRGMYLLAFIFDGGELRDEQIAGLKLHDEELNAFEFRTPKRLRSYVWRRVAVTLEALNGGQVPYLQDGTSSVPSG